MVVRQAWQMPSWPHGAITYATSFKSMQMMHSPEQETYLKNTSLLIAGRCLRESIRLGLARSSTGSMTTSRSSSIIYLSLPRSIWLWFKTDGWASLGPWGSGASPSTAPFAAPSFWKISRFSLFPSSGASTSWSWEIISNATSSSTYCRIWTFICSISTSKAFGWFCSLAFLLTSASFALLTWISATLGRYFSLLSYFWLQ